MSDETQKADPAIAKAEELSRVLRTMVQGYDGEVTDPDLVAVAANLTGLVIASVERRGLATEHALAIAARSLEQGRKQFAASEAAAREREAAALTAKLEAEEAARREAEAAAKKPARRSRKGGKSSKAVH